MKGDSRKIPRIPKEYFTRKHVPSPYTVFGKQENKTHYRYKIFLGETIRDRIPYLNINYEWNGLPSFFDERHNRFVNYQPDIFIKWHDDRSKVSYFSDIEINGLVHYKSKEQILKVIHRMNHIYPLLRNLKEVGKEDYKTVGSYIIIDKDDFEYTDITTIYSDVRLQILGGGLYPKDIKKVLDGYLSVAK